MATDCRRRLRLLQRQNPLSWIDAEDEEKPAVDLEGIYAIIRPHRQAQYPWTEILYVGRGVIRTRFNADFSNNDNQAIGRFLWDLSDLQRRRIEVVWVEWPNHQCDEGVWIDCIEEIVGYRPAFNKKQ